MTLVDSRSKPLYYNKCDRPNCCRLGLATQNNQLLPMKSIHLSGRLQDGVSTILATISYQNSDSDPIECAFELPLLEDSIVGRLAATIDDRRVEATIRDKSSAKE